MKKTLLKLFLILAAFIWLSGTAAYAGSVTINYGGDSMQVYCGAPFDAGFMVYGQTTGYLSTDSVSVYHNFGDGHDTLFYVQLANPSFYAFYDHIYQFPGVYSSLFIVTGPDGNADTLFVQDDVIDSANCGNIDGRLYIDANSNCMYDGGDTYVSGLPVELWYNSTLVDVTYTNSSGYYYFYVPNNTYTIKPNTQIANYGFSVSCPVSGQITVASPATNNDFGLTCTPGFDLHAYVWSQNFRPGFNREIYPEVTNMNCQPLNGQAKLILDGTYLTYVSAAIPPTTISGDTLIWDFTAVSNQGSFIPWPVTVYVSLSAPLGDEICVTLLADPVTGDSDPSNNTATVCRAISNSCDPNEKAVSPDGNVAAGSWLTYTVFFQNTGNDTAYNVNILDTIDANLDMSTFQPIAASHSYYTYIQNSNAVKFDFPSIMLVDSNTNEPLSHGWVSYRIKTKAALPNGTHMNNTAYIYFDFNAAVVTNTTVTVIDNSVSVNELNADADALFISPNPATNQLLVSSPHLSIVRVEIFDVVGQKVYSSEQATNGKSQTIDVSNLGSGIYFVRAGDGVKMLTQKLVIE